MKKILVYFITTLFSLGIYSQNIVYTLDINKNIFEINIDNNSSTLITTINYPTADIYDIAISPQGTFYGITSGGEIFEIDIQNGEVTVLYEFDTEFSVYSGLVCSNDNKLYSLNNDFELYSYNITSGVGAFVSNLGFNSPGDLTFYKGNLIFEAISSDTFKAYNFLNDNLVDISCFDINSYGLTNIYTGCEETRVILSYNNSIHEIDFNTNELIDLGIIANNIYGMASESENIASTCNFQFSNVDCTMSIEEQNWLSSKRITYPNPTNNLLYLKLDINIISIRIFNNQGQEIKRIKPEENSISINEFTNGLYFIEIVSEFGTRIEKIIKQ